MQDFYENFSKYVSEDDIIVLAVSGGVDSMVLLDVIAKVQPRTHIVIAHYDHSLRWEESDGDEQFVHEAASRLGVRYEMRKGDIGNMAQREKMSIEAIARRERYAFFEYVRERYRAKYILTAHHWSDQAETILMNLIKWGKARGLSGMSAISGSIYRPLLHISKGEILTYALEYNIEYREDSSNASDIYERNHIRNEILPRLATLNSTIEDTLTDLGGYMKEILEYIDRDVEKWLSFDTSVWIKMFSVERFAQCSLFFQKEIIVYLYSRAHDGSTQGLSKWLIDELIRYIMTAEGSTEKSVGKLRLEKKKKQVYYVF